MEPLWKRFAMQWRSQTWLLLSVLTIALLLLAFGILAQEVSEKEPLAFDQNIMLALRNYLGVHYPTDVRLGHGLLGTDDMAPAGRSGRTARAFMTAVQVGCPAVEALGLALRYRREPGPYPCDK